MNFEIFLLLLVVILFNNVVINANTFINNHQRFNDFIIKYEKTYENEAELYRRRQIFEANTMEIERLNAMSDGSKNGGPSFEINKFADLTKEEFKQFYLIENNFLKQHLKSINNVRANDDYNNNNKLKETSLPKEKNWYLKATTPIRNQGQCGSCWAFSCVEQVESDWFLSKGNTINTNNNTAVLELSTQQVIDCDSSGAYGCGGAYSGGGSGYRFIEENGGLASEASYPYTSGKTGKESTCKKDIPNVGGKIKNFSFAIKPCVLPWDNCDNQDEDGVMQYIATKGPLAICVNARQWIYYKSGIMSGTHCGGNDHGSLDHCVQLVGYNRSSDPAYWIVRNSWDTTWGNGGFMYLAMGNNTCGLADVPSFAIV